MSGGPDPLYVRARTALLDAADALTEQLDAVVLVAPRPRLVGPHLHPSTVPSVPAGAAHAPGTPVPRPQECHTPPFEWRRCLDRRSDR